MVALVVAALLAIATGSTVPGNFKAQGRAEYPNNDPKRKYEGPHGEKCEPNEYDEAQHCLCSQGQMLTHIKSTFADGVHDRRWELECGDDDGLPWKDHGSSNWPHDWKADMDWDGRSSNTFMVGLQSYHDNGGRRKKKRNEDRRYNVLTATLDGYVYAKDCKTYTYGYTKTIDITLGAYEAIARLESHHEGTPTYDRNWAITVCKLIPKCDQFGKIKYGDFTEFAETVKHYTEKYNGLAETDPMSLSITETDKKTLQSTYKFSETSSTSSTYGVSVTGETAFLGSSLTATVGFDKTFSSEITIGEEQSESYETTLSTKTEDSNSCGSGCHCRMTYSAQKYRGSQTYTRNSDTSTETLNEEDNECTFTGTLTAQKGGIMLFNTYEQCNIQYLVLSSYGRAAEKRGSYLGQFELQWDGPDLRKHNGRSVYKQSDLHGKERWLYFSSDNYWVVGFTLGSSDDGYLRVADDDKEFYPSTSGWEYKHDGDFHSDDITFTLQYQAEPVTPCSEVIVAAEGDTLKRQFWSWGTYRPTGLMSEGRPVYKRETVEDWGDRYLMVSGSGSSGRWSIRTRTDRKLSRVLSGRGTPSPADPEAAARPDAGYTKWRLIENNGGSNDWVEGELTFTCVE